MAFLSQTLLFKRSEKVLKFMQKKFSILLDFIKHCHNIFFLSLSPLTQTLFAFYQATVHCYSVRKLCERENAETLNKSLRVHEKF